MSKIHALHGNRSFCGNKGIYALRLPLVEFSQQSGLNQCQRCIELMKKYGYGGYITYMGKNHG